MPLQGLDRVQQRVGIIPRVLFLGALVTFLFGCYRVSQYSGDGSLFDNGIFSASNRYVLDLGPVDLTGRGTTTYRIGNLPDVRFALGIKLSTATPELRRTLEKQLANAILSLEIKGPGGETLVSKKAALGTWIWSEHQDGNW